MQLLGTICAGEEKEVDALRAQLVNTKPEYFYYLIGILCLKPLKIFDFLKTLLKWVKTFNPF